jgi:glycosyltransferase involved in cell wall biosynthesis
VTTLLITPQLGAVSETFIARHAEVLRAEGILSAIVTPGIGPDGQWQNIPVWSLGKRRLRPLYDRAWRSMLRRTGLNLSSWFTYEHAMKQLLKDHNIKFDRVLIQYAEHAYNNFIYVGRWLANGIKVVIHFHGYDAVSSSFPDDYISILNSLAEQGAVFVANSEFTKQNIAPWIPQNQLHVKIYGVEMPTKIRQHHSQNRVTILHLGRLVDFKGPDLTIKAFEIACEHGLEGNLIVAGDGELRDTCQNLREKSKWKERIELLGPVDWLHAEELRLSADIFTLHSVVGKESGRIENLGVAVLEAMSTALPIVTCALGGIKETVVDGETAILFPPGEIRAQAEAFLKLAHEPLLRKSMGFAGRRRVSEHFSIEKEKHELLRILGYTDV